jgi:hypothetical protein
VPRELLAFIHVAKTGGQSVETMLRSSYGAAHAEAVSWPGPAGGTEGGQEYVVPKAGPADLRRLKRLVPFLRSIGGHGVALWSGLEEVQPIQWFAFMRDPVKRGASHFQYHLRTERPDLTWREWVDWPMHHNHQLRMFSRQGDVDDAIRRIEAGGVFVGLTERFDESLVIFQRLLRPDLDIAYIRTNTSEGNEAAQRILADPQARGDLERMYAEEARLHEWVVHDLYPRFRQEYGPTLEADVEAFRLRRHRISRLNTFLNRAWFHAVIRPALPRAHG